MSKPIVDGIILIITCQKYQYTRLKEFKLSKNQYGNWKVIYALGDLSLKVPYKLKDDFLTIRCEDSYIHLLKKVVLTMEILYELFDIKQGILRCGDDLVFNEDKLLEFTNFNKPDYIGNCVGYINNNPLPSTTNDPFMYNYYQNHKEDFDNPNHNLKNVDISKYVIRPNLIFCSGVVVYLSNKACNVLIKHLNEIKYNVFLEEGKCFPYFIEDIGIGYILNKENIQANHYYFYRDVGVNDYSGKEDKDYIALHTNKYRDG